MSSSNTPIYIATIIDSHNYGTVLQAAATADTLSAYGKPLFIDYCRQYWTLRGSISTQINNPNGSLATNTMHTFALLARWRHQKGIFRSFVERELTLVDSTRFLEDGGKYDENAYYVTGSDQTWNYEYNNGIDPVYYFKFLPDDCRRISYAASFGRPSISTIEAEESYELLSKYAGISVREKSGVDILDSLGLYGSVALKDPVLLCRPGLWSELTSQVERCSAQYVLVYGLYGNKALFDYARAVAQEMGISALVVTFVPYKRAPEGLSQCCLPSPEKWVSLFRDANYVVTDSFHGTCFSLLFEKPMTVFDPPRYSVRLIDVLSDFGITERRVGHYSDIMPLDIPKIPIDWESVREVKSNYSAEATRFLNECFK